MSFLLLPAEVWLQTLVSAGPKVTPIPMVQKTALPYFTEGCHGSNSQSCITLVLWGPQGNHIVHRWNVDTDLIWYMWSVTKPFLLSWILRTIKERMTQLLTAKLAKKEAGIFVPVFSPLCTFHRWDSAAFSLTLQCVLSSCYHLAPSWSWPWPWQQRESNWTVWEARLRLVISCWLKAQMAQKCSKMFMQKSFWQVNGQKQKLQKATESWRHMCMQKNTELPNMHWSLALKGKVSVSLLNDWAK